MKKLLLLLAVMISTNIMAAPVTKEQAQKNALSFAASRLGLPDGTAMRMVKSMPRKAPGTGTQTTAYYYIFNLGDSNGGFVIASGDDRTEQILGYSDKGSVDANNIPENMAAWLEGYAEAIRYIDENGIGQVNSSSGAAVQRKPIGSLLQTEWNQGLPYNLSCPIIDGNYCVTGCVATALAQVMHYHRWPQVTTAEIPSYTYTYNTKEYSTEPITAGTAIDWDSMLPAYYADGTYNEKNAKAVANLMKLCGHSVYMSYSPYESLASTAWGTDALIKYFDYEEETVQMLSRVQYSYADWQDIIYNELENKRPVIYKGRSTDAGHAFVCDGYSSEDFFHINWGWGGNSDGFFRLSLLNPSNQGIGGSLSNMGFAMSQAIIIGIQPNDGVYNKRAEITVTEFSYAEKLFTRLAESQDFRLYNLTYRFNNLNPKEGTFDIGLRLTDSDGNTLQDFPLLNNLVFQPDAWYAINFTEKSPLSIGKGIGKGQYRLVSVYRPSGDTEWKESKDAETHFIGFEINNNTLTINTGKETPVLNLQVPVIKSEGNNKKGHEQIISMTIVNKGTLYRNDLCYKVNDEENYHGAAFLDMEPGETADISFGYTPAFEGKHVIAILAIDQDNMVEIAKLEINTVAAPSPEFLYKMENADATQTVNDDHFEFTLVAKNTGSSGYAGNVYAAPLFYIAPLNMFYYANGRETWPLELAPGEEAQKTFVFDGLKEEYPIGETMMKPDGWAIYIQYELEGELKSFFTPRYQLNLLDNAIATPNADGGKPAPVYSIGGQKVGTTDKFGQLKAGIYIINGKKVAKHR